LAVGVGVATGTALKPDYALNLFFVAKAKTK